MQKTPSTSSNTSVKGCLGCRSFFKDGQQLRLEDLRVEFKNFSQIPLRDSKHKYTLLKTINAFLNTKGGSIFIGVDDNECRVKGYYLSFKQQDEFKFFVKTLVERMEPPIDFSNVEEVSTCFLPVMNSEKFTGKYIIKIIVKQGKRDAVYTFAERIRLMGADKADFQEFEIRNSYKRVGPGGVEKLDPLALLQEVYRKAKSPNEQQKSHEGCHPPPLQPTFVLKNVGFSGLGHRTLREKLIDKIEARLAKQPMECEINYDEDLKLLLVEFEKEEDAEKIKNLLHDNLELLRSSEIELEYIGPENDTYLFRNKKKPEEVAPSATAPKDIKSRQTPTKYDLSQNPPYYKKPSTFQNGFFYVVTHIDVRNRDRLYKWILGVFHKRNYRYEILINSILINCSSRQEMLQIQQVLSKNQRELHSFGHNNKVVYGEMTGHLCIYNYFEKQRKELSRYVSELLKGKIIGCEFKKDLIDKTRSFMDLKLDARDAVEALDVLLEDEEIRNFRIKGGHDVPKMKFMLKCNNF